MINIEMPVAYDFLFENANTKVSFGGRAAGRSWAFARYLLLKSLEKKRLILCCREIQGSIKESIYRLLVEQIELLKLSSQFVITEKTITSSCGSEFIFRGLFRNISSIKSLEGVDICDVEEAESVSEESWQILLPTVKRKPGSEILIKFNTRYSDDPTYQRFVVNPSQDSIVRFTTYKDNRFFSKESRQEMEADFAFRPTEAANIWDGKPVGVGRKIYSEFVEAIHVKEFDMKEISNRAQCYMSMDPAMHYYPACLWMARFPDENGEIIKYVYNEYPTRNDLGDWFHKLRTVTKFSGSLSDLAREIYVRDGIEYGLKISKRSIDTRFIKGTGSGSYYSGDTVGLVSEFAKKENGGLHFVPPWEKSIDMALNSITTDLQYNKLIPIATYNHPKLYISPKCLNLMESLKNHRLEEKSEMEAPKYKDFSDGLKILYAGLDEKYVDKSGKTQVKQNPSPMYAGVGFNQNNGGTGWMGM